MKIRQLKTSTKKRLVFRRTGDRNILEVQVHGGPHEGLWIYNKSTRKCIWSLNPSGELLPRVSMMLRPKTPSEVCTRVNVINASPWYALLESNDHVLMKGYPAPYFHANLGKMYRGQMRRRIRRALGREPEVPKKFFAELFPRMNPQFRNTYFKEIHLRTLPNVLHRLIGTCESLIEGQTTFSFLTCIKECLVYQLENYVPGDRRTKQFFSKLQSLGVLHGPIFMDLYRMQTLHPELLADNIFEMPWSRINEEHDRLAYEITKKKTKSEVFPPAPFKELGWTYLANSHMLLDEGEIMSHCIASYKSQCVAGLCYIYHIEYGDEVATAELSAPYDYTQTSSTKKAKLVLRQLKSKYNGDVSPEFHEHVEHVLLRVNLSRREEV